jgi:hypothetical protein
VQIGEGAKEHRAHTSLRTSAPVASPGNGVRIVPSGHVEANVNALTNKDDIDLVTGIVRYSDVPVSMYPA